MQPSLHAELHTGTAHCPALRACAPEHIPLREGRRQAGGRGTGVDSSPPKADIAFYFSVDTFFSRRKTFFSGRNLNVGGGGTSLRRYTLFYSPGVRGVLERAYRAGEHTAPSLTDLCCRRVCAVTPFSHLALPPPCRLYIAARDALWRRASAASSTLSPVPVNCP